MRRNYEDIEDWVHLNYELKDNRLKDLKKLFDMVYQKMSSRLKIDYGLIISERWEVGNAFSEFYSKGKDRGERSSRHKDNIIRAMKKEGVFSVAIFHKNFPYVEDAFYKRENSKLRLHLQSIEYFKNNPYNYYGPNIDDVDLSEMIESIIDSTESVFDENLLKLINERVELLQTIVDFNERLRKINRRVSNIFEEHSQVIEKSLESKRKVLYVDEYEKYESKLKRNYDSVQKRFFVTSAFLSLVSKN